MNFLTHLLLSPPDAEQRAGNLLGDFVKGSMAALPTGFQRGVVLHRRIDKYTDSHPAVRAAVVELRHEHGRYAGIVLDILLDHYLARDFERWSRGEALRAYLARVAPAMVAIQTLPEVLEEPLRKIMTSERLPSYATREGMAHALEITSRRLSKRPALESAATILVVNNNIVEQTFEKFFPDLVTFAKESME